MPSQVKRMTLKVGEGESAFEQPNPFAEGLGLGHTQIHSGTVPTNSEGSCFEVPNFSRAAAAHPDCGAEPALSQIGDCTDEAVQANRMAA